MTGSIIVINVDIRETRVALVEGGVIAELQIERASHRGTVGNIVLGKVTRVLPGMQAAFIDVGQERSAFLHVEDLIRPDDFERYLAGGADEDNESFRGTGERKAAAQGHGEEDEDEEDDEAERRGSLNGAEPHPPRSAPSSDAVSDDDEDDEAEDAEAEDAEADDVDDEAEDAEADDVDDAEDDDDELTAEEDRDDDEDDLEGPESLEDDDRETLVAGSVALGSQEPGNGSRPEGSAVDGASRSEGSSADGLADHDSGERGPGEQGLGGDGLSAEASSAGIGGGVVSSVSVAVTEVDIAYGSSEGEAGGESVRRVRQRSVEEARTVVVQEPAREGRGGRERGRGRDVARAEPAADAGRGGRRRGRGSRDARGRRGRRNEGDAKLVRGRRAQASRGKNGGARPEASVPPRVTRSVPITDVVKEGDHVVVQISKEPIGTKGARVTSHVSLPGRYVVYLPTVDHLGISKRIGSARERQRLRQVMESLKPARGGLIVRTVAEGLTKKGLKADVGYLIRVWAEVCKKRETARSTDTLYTELDLVLKVARDLFTDEVKTIVIDDREQYHRLVRFVEMFLPERVKDIELYTGSEPIFDAYGIEDEIGRALSRKVPLPSGGSLIVDQAEALTAIDVNTGRYVGKGSKDLEETALKTNLEAVEEIAYQLRFRNIGGLVILDLIDMEKYSNREKVWRALEAALVKDKAKTTLNRISELGLIEMTRKRTRESLGRMLHEPCFYCDGTGQIQSKATIAYEILRQIGRERYSLPGYSVVVNAHPAIVDFLKTVDRGALEEAERRYTRRIELNQRTEYHIEQYDLQGK
jgi:ribonuclease G